LLQGLATWRGDGVGDHLEGFQVFIDLVADYGRQRRGGCKLLLAQQALHVGAQHVAGVERDRPDAAYKDE
jgi:hypothetical protein